MHYVDYIMETVQKLLAIPSPTGFTHNAAAFALEELQSMGYEPYLTRKGAVLTELSAGTGAADRPILLAAHMDTLGAMVEQIKENGHLKLTRVGGLMPNNTEGENCHIHTRDGRVYDATFQLANPSVHVNGEYADTKRSYETMEAIVDELVSDRAGVEALGICNGDFVSFEPRTVLTKSGYIKSRFLDDKLSTCILLAFAKYLKEQKVTLKRRVYMMLTTYEEVGHGCSASIPEDVEEILCLDMGCVGDGLTCDETMVSICAKDSHGPYDYEVVSNLIRAAKENDISFAVDVYPHYGSDADAALTAGYDVRHGLIGPGVFASHGYERSHRLGAENTFRLLCAYFN